MYMLLNFTLLYFFNIHVCMHECNNLVYMALVAILYYITK